MPAAKKEVVGRATSFRSMGALTDLAFGRISHNEYSAREQKVVVRPVCKKLESIEVAVTGIHAGEEKASK